ncbi:hypothetical protein [Endozoicomonas ascidiicola]|uniref:hypothetical protein n=1 Tax=Endozoicomonas ascidiicola TaxID=1698521 RepID=UPI0008300035|nr:hypothetical protein [Endozoicomonas ascidiicola]
MLNLKCTVFYISRKRITVVLFGVLLFLYPFIARASECYPVADQNSPQYMIGYGDLLYGQSENRNYQHAIPVKVDGYKRGWLTKSGAGDTLKKTDLGVMQSVGSVFNGILFPITPSEIRYTDRQQIQTCRIQIRSDQLAAMTSSRIPEQGQFWIYQTRAKFYEKPSSDYPIRISAVDEFLTGCIRVAEQFQLKSYPEECVATTWFWSSHWVNDRPQPLKPKPAQVDRKAVNKLLESLEGDIFGQVRAY